MEQIQYFEKAISWAQKNGYSNIKANHEDYENPSPFRKPGEKEADAVIPDITGVKTGGKSYFEIVDKSENTRSTVSKWILLCKMAAIKGGKFFLLAPKGHKAYADKLVRKYSLDAKVVSI